MEAPIEIRIQFHRTVGGNEVGKSMVTKLKNKKQRRNNFTFREIDNTVLHSIPLLYEK